MNCTAGKGDVGGGEGQDLLSALPDDVLLRILCHLPSIAAAAQTSVVSRRWRHLWEDLPELQFPHPANLVRARTALALHIAPAIHLLHVIVGDDADAGNAAAILHLIAHRLTGRLSFLLEEAGAGAWAEAGAGDVIDLPCFDKGANIDLRLGYHGLALPQAGVFAKLTVMYLEKIHFRGPEILGDVLSSARCPSLQWIGVLRARGLSNLTIHSKTLLGITLHHLEGFQQLTIVSRKLKKLDIVNIFEKRQPLANVTAPVLEVIRWFDNYDPFSVQLGELAQVQELRSLGILGHGFPSLPYNRDPLRLLCRFQKIPILYLHITYPIETANFKYFTEVITSLPNIENLHLRLIIRKHAFGPSMFHLLKAFSGINKLDIQILQKPMGKAACSPSCQCHQLQDLETEELSMNSLQEVEISQCRGGYYEHAFLKRVIRWAPALKKVIVTFDPSVTVVTEELCQELLRLPGPEICMRIYLYRDGEKVIYAPAA